MSKAGKGILKSARAARAYARGNVTGGLCGACSRRYRCARRADEARSYSRSVRPTFWLVGGCGEGMGGRKPERATRVLLTVIEREPEAVKRALEIA